MKHLETFRLFENNNQKKKSGIQNYSIVADMNESLYLVLGSEDKKFNLLYVGYKNMSNKIDIYVTNVFDIKEKFKLKLVVSLNATLKDKKSKFYGFYKEILNQVISFQLEEKARQKAKNREYIEVHKKWLDESNLLSIFNIENNLEDAEDAEDVY